MAYEKAVYVYKNGGWKNANDDLIIRDKDSFSSPTNSNVPKVYARTSTEWLQIYPARKQTQSPLNWVSGSGYKNWQGGERDIELGYSIWGWSISTPALPNLQWTGGQGFFGTGVYSYEKDVFKQFAGWTGITRSAITNAGYKGLGKVTAVKKLTLRFDFNVGTASEPKYVGTPGSYKKIGLIATKVSAPHSTTASSANPCVSANRSKIVYSDNSNPTNGSFEFTWTSNDAKEVLKDFLNGKNSWNNLCTYTGSYPIYNANTGTYSNCTYTSDYLYTNDYCRYSKVEFKIEYEYEP